METATSPRMKARRTSLLLLLAIVTAAAYYSSSNSSHSSSMVELHCNICAAMAIPLYQSGVAKTKNKTLTSSSRSTFGGREREEGGGTPETVFEGKREDESLRSVSRTRTRRRKKVRSIIEYSSITAGAVGFLVAAALLLRCNTARREPRQLPDATKSLPPSVEREKPSKVGGYAQTVKAVLVAAPDDALRQVTNWKRKWQKLLRNPQSMLTTDKLSVVLPMIGLAMLAYHLMRKGIFQENVAAPGLQPTATATILRGNVTK